MTPKTSAVSREEGSGSDSRGTARQVIHPSRTVDDGGNIISHALGGGELGYIQGFLNAKNICLQEGNSAFQTGEEIFHITVRRSGSIGGPKITGAVKGVALIVITLDCIATRGGGGTGDGDIKILGSIIVIGNAVTGPCC